MKISKVISTEIEEYSKSTEIVDGLDFKWHETVRRIKLYKVDKYMDNNDDAIFWNISSPQTPHFKKNIDLDTKDFRPEGKGNTNFVQAWILKIKFEKWARDSQLGIIINDLISDITDFGFAVWKRVPTDEGEDLELCDLSNISFDVTAKSFRNTSIIEKHELTEMEMRDKDDAWDNVSQAIEQEKKESKDDKGVEKYTIYERIGEFKEDDKYKYMHHIVCGEGDNEVILFEEEMDKDDNIYYAFSLRNAKGRLPGVGIYERLFKIQQRCNTLINENAQTTAIASLLLLRSNDPNLQGNVLTEAQSGQIITSADLQQIGMDNRALNSFLQEMELIEDHARKLCLTPEVVTGENLPSGTPFRSMAALTSAAKTAFKSIRDNIGIGIADVLIEKILPSVVQEWNRESILEIADNDQDMEFYDNAVIRKTKIKLLKERLAKKKHITEEEFIKLEQKIKEDIELLGRKITIPKKFFDFEYGIRINPTSESYDKAQQNDAYFNVISWVASNPAILNLPLTKQYLENNGISWWKLNPRQLMEMQQAQQQGQTQVQPQAQQLKKPDKLLKQTQ